MGSEIVQIVFGLLGGLAIFIYGMNLMSEGLQKVAGDKMRAILEMLTKNPLIGVLAGALTTAVLQSSAATTVMVIGFVSASLMTLPQAISIILGANIGTTMTAQLIAFKLDDFVWPIIFVGFVFYFMAKKAQIKHIGQTVFGFGLLFLGIIYMGDTMKPLVGMPVFADIIFQVKEIPILGILFGTIMTIVVQSSSAVIAVLQNLASQAGPDGVSSIIGLEGALPILFGSNIGTTITSILASIGGSSDAKRTAAAHTVFNISGTLLFIFIVPQFCDVVRLISPHGPELSIISREIANAHTLFNLICTILWLPFIGVLVKIVTRLVPEKKSASVGNESLPLYLDYKIIDQPVFALHLATQELSRIAQMIVPMLKAAERAFLNGDEDAVAEVAATEINIDALQSESVKYLSSIFAEGELTEHQTTQISGLLHVAGDIEHMGDQCQNIAEFAQEKMKKGYQFSDRAVLELSGGFAQVKEMVQDTIHALMDGHEDLARDVLVQEDAMDHMETRLRKHHMERLERGECSPEFTVLYTDVLHNLEKIGDYCTNIAQAVLKDINFNSKEAKEPKEKETKEKEKTDGAV